MILLEGTTRGQIWQRSERQVNQRHFGARPHAFTHVSSSNIKRSLSLGQFLVSKGSTACS
jgi:hypothetical protein